MKRLTILVCFAVACLFAACASSPAGADTMCVFQEKQAKIMKMHDGREVGFCCKKCEKKWDAMSDDEKAQALAK